MAAVLKEEVESEEAVGRLLWSSECYWLRRVASISYVKRDGDVRAVLRGLPSRLVAGVGSDRATARISLTEKIHRHFQRLYKTLPMQRSADDETLWKALDAVINTQRYRRDRKTILPVTAAVVESTASGLVVDWFGGGRLSLSADALEGEWNTLSPGDWIEAVISRRAVDGRILKATMVRQIPPIRPFTDDEAIAWHSALPAADLPASTAE